MFGEVSELSDEKNVNAGDWRPFINERNLYFVLVLVNPSTQQAHYLFAYG